MTRRALALGALSALALCGAGDGGVAPAPGAWVTAALPVHIRSGHSATLLGDGTVLVAGGGSAADTTEIFDPARARFTAGPRLIAKHTRHTATRLLSGEVLIAGGQTLPSPKTTAAEIYDPVARTFTAAGALGTARAGHAAVRLRSGKVLVVGGAGAGDLSTEIYDPATRAFAPGPPRAKAMGDGALATLASGKVFFIGGMGPAEIFDPDASTWTPVAAQPSSMFPLFGRQVTLRGDGTVVVASSIACVSTAGGDCQSYAEVFDPNANGGLGGFSAPVNFPQPQSLPQIAALPSGDVLYAGGSPPIPGTQLFDPVQGPVADTNMQAPHGGGTATMLPGGDVLVMGGDQAGADLRVGAGATRLIAATMVHGRAYHGAARLASGQVLIAGGEDYMPYVTRADAELFDPATETFTATGAMTVGRTKALVTRLASGKVLVTGGLDARQSILASAEVYDPAAGAFHAVGAMSTPRYEHAAALLPGGGALVTGGCGDANLCVVVAPLDTAEIFDPVTETFHAAGKMSAPYRQHGMARLPTGKILVVGAASADLYDPAAGTFAATAPPGGTREGATLTLLANGGAFVAGGSTLAAEVYDAVAASWSFTGMLPYVEQETRWAPTADGRLLATGGHGLGTMGEHRFAIFDPRASPGAGAVVYDGGAQASRGANTATLLVTGGVLVTGGEPCWGSCLVPAFNTALLWSDGAPDAARPVITSVPPTVMGGAQITIQGHGFANVAEGSDGTAASSASNAPTAVWVAEESGDAVVPGRVRDFTDTSATWIAPATALAGRGLLFVNVGGVTSHGVPLEILPAPQATACALDAECATGFCVDGVCCDSRCDGKCQGCSAARKMTGADGTCGAVPPGHDPKGQCFALQGAACKDAVECTTGFCVEGVCCDSTCAGTCLSCAQAGHVGECSAINQGACDVACDGDHTLKKVGAPDVDCAPFKCDGKTCRTTCASARDCVGTSVCSLDGLCVAPVNATPSNVTVWGCDLAPAGDGAPAFAIAIALAAAIAGRRRRAAP